MTGLVSTSRAMRSISALAAAASSSLLELQHKIFALTDIFNSLILHLLECVVDGLPLGIKDGSA